MSHIVESVIRLSLRGVEFILDHAEARALIAKLQTAVGDRTPPATCPPPSKTSDMDFEYSAPTQPVHGCVQQLRSENRAEPTPTDTVSVNCPVLEVVDGCLHLPTPSGLFVCSLAQTAMIHKILSCVSADPETQITERSGGLVIAYKLMYQAKDGYRVIITGDMTESPNSTVYMEFALPEARAVLDILNKYKQAETTKPVVPRYAAIKDNCLTLAVDAEFK